MKQIIIVFISIFFLTNCSSSKKNKTIEKPNVLFISVDDLNDWEGALLANPQVKTPNMDKLFGQGVLFTNAHCSQAVCTASRNSLLSGMHPTTSGWYSSTQNMRKNYDTVMANHKMLPEHFKNNGYNTYAAGKVFHDGESDYPDKTDNFWTAYAPHFWNGMEKHIKENGFGYRGNMFYPFPKGGGQLVQLYGEDNINENYKDTNRFYSLCGGPLEKEDIPKEGMYDEQIANWAINKLNESQEKPFFLAVGFIRPHVPYTAPKKYFDLYPIEDIIVPEVPENEMEDIPMMGKAIAYGYTPKGGWGDVSAKKEILPELVQSYLACVSFVDDQIGKVIDALEKSPHAKNTIIVLWSDHGQHLGEKRHFRKQALWEEATRVPLFFKVPNNKSNGQKSSQVVSLLDIYPTLTELCNLPKLPKLEGVSLVPLINSPEKKEDRAVLTTWYYKNHAVRSNDWRYIHYRDGGEELYNHKTDPGEHINLANNPDYAEIIEVHKKWLPKYDAIPAGSKTWKGDSLDKLIQEWVEKDSIPLWLK
ncbi:arylsulfatase A-like enzyme [Mariniflexile fucanivorans]|uniref:Arylsulfatase A-like enzyme n=1 Tax=Mariniflexile fucanivorans TaxID=264023 RepID=A0A4R1RL14_9FLAO|nr:sulfatase [Mariniflexile fucanivorans]TCL66901.1 arylsulfatase A-like enzyme [Mariniflexile fucanivorans]